MRSTYPIVAMVLFLIAGCISVKRDHSPATTETTTTAIRPGVGPGGTVSSTTTTTY